MIRLVSFGVDGENDSFRSGDGHVIWSLIYSVAVAVTV